jgi:hypothetical protein
VLLQRRRDREEDGGRQAEQHDEKHPHLPPGTISRRSGGVVQPT